MYNKKTFQPTEIQIRQLQELIKSPSWVALLSWADYEYVEGCKYGMSLIPSLDLMSDEDKATLEKEYHAVMAVSEWLERVKRLGNDYIGDKIKE